MATRAGVIKGTALRIGVSKNHRMYTKEAIADAVSRVQDRLTTGGDFPVMFSGHLNASEDDPTKIVGKVTSMTVQPDGSAAFEADVPDTALGRDILTLVDPQNPFLKGVSIRGKWMGDVKTEKAPDGSEITVCDSLDVVGLDFTHAPGVVGAGVEYVGIGESASEGILFESVEDAQVFVDEAKPKTAAPAGTVYADPGYQKDKKPRYPLNSVKRIRAAWSYINVAENGSKYSANQLARIKTKIKSAAKKAGVDITSETAIFSGELQEIIEAYVSMCVDNGPGDIRVSGYTQDNKEIANLASHISAAALAALNTLDPDEDGDIDLSAPAGESIVSTEAVDHPAGVELQLCGDCQGILDDTNLFCPSCGLPVSAAGTGTTDDNDMESTNVSGVENTPTDNAIKEPTNEEAPVADDTKTVTEETPAVDTNTAILAALTALTESVKELKTPAPVVETPAAEVKTEAIENAPKTFTEAELEALVAERTKTIQEEAVAAAQEAGSRKGFTLDNMSESQIVKEVSEMDKDELHSVLGASIIQDPVFARISNRAQSAVRGPTFFDA